MTYDQYRNMLRVNKHRLDDELEIQAEIQEQLSAEVARLNTRAIEAKDELVRVESRLIEDFREGATKDIAEAKAKRHPDRVKVWERYQHARELHETWSGLLSAWTTRGYKLADLGSLFASDYFAIRTITRPDGERRRELNAADEESRSAVRRASERVNAAEPQQPRGRVKL